MHLHHDHSLPLATARAESSPSTQAKIGYGSEYFAKHQTILEEAVSCAIAQALSEEAADPTARVGELLLSQSKSSARGGIGATPAEAELSPPDKVSIKQEEKANEVQTGVTTAASKRVAHAHPTHNHTHRASTQPQP